MIILSIISALFQFFSRAEASILEAETLPTEGDIEFTVEAH